VSEVVVTAPARLHFGMLDPIGVGTRRFGGFGVGIESPRVVVGVRRAPRVGRDDADGVLARGAQADRAASFARRARAAFGLDDGVEVDVRETIPPHSGLGSGTKLGLAVARGVAELAGLSPDPERLAQASGRGARSSVGCWTFAAPGLVVEAGVSDAGWVSPLVARHPMPECWRCVLALPRGAEGLSGDAEERFFHGLHEPPPTEPPVSRLLLTALLPGLLTGDIDEFGAALSEIQREMGSMFSARQGGTFHPRSAPLVDALQALGAPAVGQSSWGPAVYGIVDSPGRAAEVAGGLRATAGDDTAVAVVDFDRRGASIARDGAGSVLA
jgi:beta-RFAP synthase